MNRLLVRMILSHVLVAVLGVLATYLVVRRLAPALFDQGMAGMGPGMGQGQPGLLRQQFGDAVDSALLVGALVGALAAAAFGTLAAYRLIRPLDALRAAARKLAAGRYDATAPVPHERELAELAHDINRLGSTLAATETRRVRLLGEVAHEMRTPLTVMDGYLEGMIDGVLPAGPAELGQVGEEVRRLRRLSDDLSALSRSDEGRLDLRPVRVDLREVVAPAVQRLQAQAEDADLTLGLEAGPDPVVVDVDEDRIAQVVTNLVGNALQATPAGGRVAVTVRGSATGAEIVVADTGVGLARDDLERVFERFYRAGRASDRREGSGIGLTIARGIVRAHHGDLTADSPGPGRGSVFTVRLPAAR
ncbi:MAG TPA: HAMP domain-containing sensor histidine kinase [Nocardioides sp.]|uniref:sensor histidine kinase n=1 Tax=Nocardioides sp. TaxID=35761 RepID=UPI002CC1A528|nr:HAMP domain-containing sensor histidine kinase [Nocardioides sp.]HQR25631.1 HAMP domain-containing sensor histidine kinase [Nocardioides sp.]